MMPVSCVSLSKVHYQNYCIQAQLIVNWSVLINITNILSNCCSGSDQKIQQLTNFTKCLTFFYKTNVSTNNLH